MTQRGGALSRMVDLGLTERVRDGRLVRYAIAGQGQLWRRRLDTSLSERAV